MNEGLKLKGKVKLELFDVTGAVKGCWHVDNLVVTSGLALVASALATGACTAMTHMAVGSGTTAADLAQTALVTELARSALTSTTVVSNVITYVADFAAGAGTGALTEIGLFNATPAGTMLARTLYPVVNKGATDTLAVTWTLTLG